MPFHILSCVFYVGLPPAILDPYLELLVEGSADFAFAVPALRLKYYFRQCELKCEESGCQLYLRSGAGLDPHFVRKLMESKRAT